ncbi:PASTA domain-containing protein [Flavobacteriaceae bacterium]|nr:PASTA domain-containing protein [Flavobacteriaceae bacterium]MDC1064501.1 PASTA domain-containing protein [Flavobacteriaceae bacterium]MDC3227804.1 PASTA domain-containing protein [Flavobacteriaceae bacterium]
MNFIKYIFSKYFFKQLFKAIVLTLFFVLVLYFYLNITTNHNKYINVPELKGVNLNKAKVILEENNLSYIILDSALYNPDYPKFSVLEQLPKSNSQVKKNRKIYLTLNPSNYGKVSIPNIIQITQRSANSSLLASGLEIGDVSYENNIGKDMVLEILFNGNKLNIGDMVPKKSKIDLILGNGKTEEK